jgi:hypothetical protein
VTETRTIDQLVEHALADPEPEITTEEWERRKNEARRQLEERYADEIAAEEKARAETQAARTTTQEGDAMATKRVKFTGYLEVPAGVDMDLGYEVTITRGRGEVTGKGDKLTRKDSGESTVTKTFNVTLDPDATTIGQITKPEGPLERELAEATAE